MAAFRQYDVHCGLPVWDDDHYSDMVIWAVPMALAGQSIENFSEAGGLLDQDARLGEIASATARPPQTSDTCRVLVRRFSGINSPCASISSSTMLQIWSRVSSAEVWGSSIAAW